MHECLDDNDDGGVKVCNGRTTYKASFSKEMNPSLHGSRRPLRLAVT